MQSTINLLRPNDVIDSRINTVKAEARRIALVGFIVSVISGFITFILIFILQSSLQSVQQTNTNLKSQLESEKTKESMLAVVKSRIQVVNKALEYSKPIDKVMTNAIAIGAPPKLYSFAYDDSGTVTVNYKVTSIEDSASMVSLLLSDVDAKRIRNPHIMSYTFDKNGVNVTFSFMPVWENL